LFIFLLRAAGHRKGTDAVVPSFVEKIPFDLFTLLSFCAIYVCLVPLAGGWDWPEILFVLIPCVLAAGLLFLLWCMSFAVRVKMRTLWKSCLLVRFCSWIVRGVRSVFRNLPILWKWIVGIVAAALIDLIFRMNAVWSENRAAFFWALFWLLAGLATLYAVLSFRRLRRGAAAIARGDYSTKIDSRHMIGDMKAHAADLEHIRDGIDLAVEERMKSERFRTELITNVSHDIKTPLTSIVNYVDLLAREEPQTDKQREYIEVLSRQSAKLKKLIGDLIEASKASTGDLPVDLQELDLSVLLDQTAGEYGERIADAGLELVLKKPEDPVKVMADGKHLWRIFDNLLNNVVKYAQPGTRVYLTLEERGNKAVLSFRNISREPLDVSGAELVERFVRGDSSRNTEGSGLGLSIAMSLTRLQKGAMAVAVDGDLFKVTLSFDKV
ncbi:MAG: HAMP domain-containing histidine kinase, partial [Oscillospiraceae bacterium]|nr:HAMP domain-containing histidine kinase [Oscillospiraceae bacterium]